MRNFAILTLTMLLSTAVFGAEPSGDAALDPVIEKVETLFASKTFGDDAGARTEFSATYWVQDEFFAIDAFVTTADGQTMTVHHSFSVVDGAVEVALLVDGEYVETLDVTIRPASGNLLLTSRTSEGFLRNECRLRDGLTKCRKTLRAPDGSLVFKTMRELPR